MDFSSQVQEKENFEGNKEITSEKDSRKHRFSDGSLESEVSEYNLELIDNMLTIRKKNRRGSDCLGFHLEITPCSEQ